MRHPVRRFLSASLLVAIAAGVLVRPISASAAAPPSGRTHNEEAGAARSPERDGDSVGESTRPPETWSTGSRLGVELGVGAGSAAVGGIVGTGLGFAVCMLVGATSSGDYSTTLGPPCAMGFVAPTIAVVTAGTSAIGVTTAGSFADRGLRSKYPAAPYATTGGAVFGMGLTFGIFHSMWRNDTLGALEAPEIAAWILGPTLGGMAGFEISRLAGLRGRAAIRPTIDVDPDHGRFTGGLSVTY